MYTGQCPVLQRDAAQELDSLEKSERLLRYNSPDMSGVHRTVRCAPDCPVHPRSNGYFGANGYLRCI